MSEISPEVIMEKADYSKIASFYDKSRSISEENMIMWLGLIAAYWKGIKAARVLDLGCGTGRFALPMARRFDVDVTGVDSSAEMLAKAEQKDVQAEVTWLLAEASRLPFANGSYDFVFMSHLLHHVDRPLAVIEECHRVLKPAGNALIRYGAMNQIRNDVEHTFFPQVREINEPRTPTQDKTEEWLFKAGFTDISSQKIKQKTFQNAKARIDAARAKGNSVLSMISETSYQTGMRRLSRYAAKNPNDPWLLFDLMTHTSGKKRKSMDL